MIRMKGSISPSLRVFLTGCEIDRSPVACEAFNVRLQSGNLVLTPSRFKESEKKQGFVVPKEFRSLKTFAISVDAERERLLFDDHNIAFLKGNWHVGIDHAPFKEETPVYGAASTVRCVGFIVFEWGEPEIVAWAPCK